MPTRANTPLIVAIDMGYGHLRPAHALAEQLGLEVLHADREPIATPDERRRWANVRAFHESGSRISQIPVLGWPMRQLFDRVSAIDRLHPLRDLSAATMGVRALEHQIKRGIGASLMAHLEDCGGPLITTFYAPAIIADRLGYERVACVVTDSDINRVWAPMRPHDTNIRYLVPTDRTRQRLLAYGVPPDQVVVTGFPLPHCLVGKNLERLKANLSRRLSRLDPTGVFHNQYGDELAHSLGDASIQHEGDSPLLTFAVGGAGAQAEIAGEFLPSLAPLLTSGAIRVALIAGVRNEVAHQFERAVQRSGLSGQLGETVTICVEDSFVSYLDAFNDILADTDILWTKPSEMTFFAALGIPLVFSPAVGHHEHHNRRWAIENGAGMRQRDPQTTADWITELLRDGTFANAAWCGFRRFPKRGTYRILEVLRAI